MVLPAIRDDSGPEPDDTAPVPLTLPAAEAGSGPTKRHLWRRRRWIGLAAVLIVALCLVVALLTRNSGNAMLVGAIGAKWGDSSLLLVPGQALPRSELAARRRASADPVPQRGPCRGRVRRGSKPNLPIACR